jgi:hypothetical protein
MQTKATQNVNLKNQRIRKNENCMLHVFCMLFLSARRIFFTCCLLFKNCDLPVAFFCISLYSFKNCDLPMCQSLCCFLFYMFYPFVFAKVLHFLHVWLGFTLFTCSYVCLPFFACPKIVICQ